MFELLITVTVVIAIVVAFYVMPRQMLRATTATFTVSKNTVVTAASSAHEAKAQFAEWDAEAGKDAGMASKNGVIAGHKFSREIGLTSVRDANRKARAERKAANKK